MVPFITNAQILDRVDARWIGDNILDDGTTPSEGDLADTGTTAGARLEQLAVDASEELMGACAVAARYTEDDVRTYGGNLLLKIMAGLVVGGVLGRRVRAAADQEAFSPMYKASLDYLEQLRRGERIFFNVPDVPEAGLPGTASMTPVPGLDAQPLITCVAGRYMGDLTINRNWPFGGCGGGC